MTCQGIACPNMCLVARCNIISRYRTVNFDGVSKIYARQSALAIIKNRVHCLTRYPAISSTRVNTNFDVFAARARSVGLSFYESEQRRRSLVLFLRSFGVRSGTLDEGQAGNGE